MGRLDARGNVLPDEYTSTGHIANLWAVGPSLLWFPFLFATHLGVLLCDRLGAHIAADGFSTPYVVTMAFATAFYGFLGLWLSFTLARKYFAERWALLATLGIWWASSLPVYMYFNPSWSHAHSAFAVALFLWYWNRTRGARTIAQWILLGLLSGFIVDVYYPNGALLVIPLLEGIADYWSDFKSPAYAGAAIARLFVRHLIYVSAFAVALLPTLVTRYIIFGNSLQDRLCPGGRLGLEIARALERAVLLRPWHAQLDADPDSRVDRLAAFSRVPTRHSQPTPSWLSWYFISWSRCIPIGTACRPSAPVSSSR